MKRLVIVILFAAVILVLLPFSVPVYANYSIVKDSFDAFDFDEYMDIIAEMAKTEEHPHYLAENSQRYKAYQESNPNIPFDKVIAYVNVNIDLGHYEEIVTVADPDKITVLVNKNFALPSEWEPDDFVDIGGGHLMRREAAEMFNNMRDAMREANMNLTVVVTYRSYARQRNHYNNAVARNGRANAEAGFARAGHSEHQTGLAIDVLHKGHDGGLMMHQGFEGSRQIKWLIDNAYEFGFILRFPEGYRNLSGFIYEPWHWRYVGIPVATAMHNEGIKLYEEFYGRYLAQGVQEKVKNYVLEQQAIAEAAEAAAIAEAEAAAAAEEAAQLAAAEEAEMARITEELMEAARKAAEARLAEQEATEPEPEMPSGNRHFLEGIAAIGIILIIIILSLTRRSNRR